MATEAAGEPAAAPPPDVGSAAERAARGDAPIKLQYVRSVATRVHVGAVSGGRLPAAAAQATAVGDAQPRAVEGKSKKQAKKVRPCCGGHGQHLLDLRTTGEHSSCHILLDNAPLFLRLSHLAACRTASSSGSAPPSSAPCLRWANASTATRAGKGAVNYGRQWRQLVLIAC